MELARSFPSFGLRTPVALVAAATLLALMSTAQSAAELSYGGEAVPWSGLLRARLTDWYGCVLFVPFLFWLAKARPIGRTSWAAALPLHFAASLACALGKEALCVSVANWFRPGIFRLPEVLAGDFFDEVLLFWAVIGLIHAFLGQQHADAAEAAPRQEPDAAGDRFVVRAFGASWLVRAEDVDWIDAQGNYARLHTPVGTPLVRETMAALECRLGPRFVRVHRGVLVNRAKVERIHACSHGRYRIFLSSGANIVSGRTYNRAVRRLLG